MDILNALVKHYDAMAAAGNATPFGWTHKFAQYAVELNDDGEIDRIFALGDLSDKKNKGEEFKMPTRRPRSGKLPIPYVFGDDAEHLLGKVGEASNLVRYTMMRDAVFMLRDLLGHSKALDVVYKFYETWDPEKALDNKCVSDVMEAKGQEKKTFILFYNGVPVFDDETFRKSYAAIVNKYGEMPIDTLKGGEIALLPEPIKIRSMISGNIGFKARLFRAITAWGNKKNGPVTNTLLSNNKANTEYFGRQQGNAIPITMQDEHKIYEAATDLLGSKHRFPVPATSQSLYSKNQIIWSDDMPTKLEDAVIDLCCCRSDKAKTISQANESGSETTIRILEKTKLYQGRITVLSDIEKNLVVNVWNLDMNNKGCSASSFTQMTLDELLGNFAKHYTDMEIDRSQTCRDADGTSRDFARAINIYNSLFAKNSDGSTSSFNNALWKQLSISIYSGTKYPEQVLSLALLRSCRLLQQNKKGKENRITASLAGITKAFLIRNYGENMTMGLNSNNTSPAYITGRIFAHMESAQRKIDPNNQTTYAKRFFERVMMNPAKTMPELHKSFLLLKNKAKANGMRGLYNSSDKKIMALIDMLDGNYPDHLSEKQKGEYLVGYYQQRSANIKDAEEKKNRKAAKIETNNTDTATTVATQKEK